MTPHTGRTGLYHLPLSKKYTMTILPDTPSRAARSSEPVRIHMLVTINKWGNSLGVRLPRAVAADLGITDGSRVDLRIEDGRLVGTVVEPEPSLASLLARITPDNLHAPALDDGPRGGEVW